MRLLIFALAPLLLAGCATTTGDAKKDARGRATNQALTEAATVLGKVAVSALFNAAMSDGHSDFQSSAATALWSNVDAASTGAAVKRIVDAYGGGKAPQTAAVAALAFDAAPASDAAKVKSIASVISTAAGAPPAK